MRNKLFVLSITLFSFNVTTSAESIRVVTEHFPPFQISEQNKPVKGVAVRLVKKIMAEVNFNAPIEVYPWARAYKVALEQPNVLIFSIARTKDREKLFHWIGSISPLKGHIWTLKEHSHVKINTIDDANQYSIAVTREDSTHHYLKQNNLDKNLDLYLTTTNKQNIEMLFSKRIDLIIATDAMIKTHLESSDLQYELLKKVFTFNPNEFQLYIAMSKSTSPLLVQRFKAAFEKIQNHVDINK
ncbi:transporter substrate-binding domain-containing protein [Pseudoalteromonas sp. MMG013]|uniref:substrate-binding periplasmic protein n=1 Tax=Pseudoalteromonas sp. MMG013 TaxID=2822687 RepID=UPI001FFC55AC|nr:transporter substrate-binding domain-containing protein [Pseudoalteromonas sp. MMG013]